MQPPPSSDPLLISFLVPAHNEADNLPQLIDRLLAIGGSLGVGCEILIIDDASLDATADVGDLLAARHPAVRILRKQPPRGLGGAVRFGLEHCRGAWAVVVMADGVDPLESALPQFLQHFLRRDCQLVLLSRYRNPGDSASIPLSYRTLQYVFRRIVRHLLRVPYPDTTYAFRAMDVAFVRKLGLRSRGFEISPEITFKTVLAGGTVREVAGRQGRRVRGRSKFRFVTTAFGYARVVCEALAHRLRLLNGPGLHRVTAGAPPRDV